MEKEIVNRVAKSNLITIDLDNYVPDFEFAQFDIKDLLTDGFYLKEKDFRKNLKNVNWNIYNNKFVAVYCSIDTIIPNWGYMLVAKYLYNCSNEIFFGDIESFKYIKYKEYIKNKINIETFKNQRVLLKGCSNKANTQIYFIFTEILIPVVKSLMYGEACSAVPVFKK